MSGGTSAPHVITLEIFSHALSCPEFGLRKIQDRISNRLFTSGIGPRSAWRAFFYLQVGA